MIKFVTLNTIIHDLLEIVRGAQVSRSEPISLRQIEAWVHQYRAKLLKQDLDKGKHPNSDYIQTIQALELVEVDEAEGTPITTGYRTFRTKVQLPKTVNLNFKPGFTYVGTITGQEFQFSPEERARWQPFRKYTSGDKIAYLKDKYLYVHNDKEIRYITVRGIFEIPPEVDQINDGAGLDNEYPIPIDMLPVLKEMILKQELNIEVKAYSDITNESASKHESPAMGQPAQVSRANR